MDRQVAADGSKADDNDGMDDVDKETTIDVRDARQLRCIFALAGSTPGRRVSRMFECKGQTKTTAFSRA
jgi:hypothetical protein|tara:strand:- start:418 stop:624 length:207 start_codon:yes stop_codon:yes gene_type:complete